MAQKVFDLCVKLKTFKNIAEKTIINFEASNITLLNL
jgi:hypothetical protein